MAMKVALYARVSSESQDVGLSISAQLNALREYANTNGYIVVQEFVDEAFTGRTIRSGLSQNEMQQAIEEQRRLFYVAITRTRHTLVLSSAASAPFADAMGMALIIARRLGPNVVLQASPFMSELGQQAPTALSGNQWRVQLGF